ncbi:hypothetical protein ITP53_47070 [Nonomuraea sp. K274]|uniref:Uncharacterized protein n=1 Tax=Nonomuraea cypriaca TaxID=1187855 RepID=A0A931AJY3_9ACTN|nr:hypothetical protein [Nonomuraea cypriaca]MBF8193110.1 hypothetical protein [Nonomuraea cypriaca]
MRAWLVVGWLCLVPILQACGTGADRAADARTVYCLGGGQRAALAEAAVALQLAMAGTARDQVTVSGRELTLEDWRKERAPAFDRACSALAAASKDGPAPAPSSGLDALLAVLLPVALGAGLTLVTAEWRSARDLGRLRADGVRTAAHAFVEAARDYAGAWVGLKYGDASPRDDLLGRLRGELDGQLRRVEVVRRGWRAVGRLRATLDSGPLGASLSEGWQDASPARAERERRLEAVLAEFDADCERVAHGLERPGRRHPELRAATPDGEGSAG